MNPSDPLEQLHPLREPAAISWWPLAPGWWILLLILLIALGCGLYLLYRRHRRNAYRRRALAKLEIIQRSNSDTLQRCTEINALLKATALQAWSHRNIASCHSLQWLALLNNSLPAKAPQFAEDWIGGQYRPATETIDMDAFINTTQNWIKHHEADHA